MLEVVMQTMRLVANCVIRQGDLVLMLQKPQRGWWSAPGGKVEVGESLAEAVVREVAEETGLSITDHRLRGIFTILRQDGDVVLDHVMLFTFYTESFTGTAKTLTEEGRLEWIPISELATRPMAEGDRYFLPDIIGTKDLITGKFCYTADHRLIYWQRE